MVEVRPPRLERSAPMVLSGILRQHNPAREGDALHQNVTAQWGDYFARRVPPPQPSFNYGVFLRMADGDVTFGYFSGAPAVSKLRQPADFGTLEIPALYWAVFRYTGHVFEIKAYMRMIFGTVLPMAGLEPAADARGVPEFVERYGIDYDPESPGGGFDILVPLKE